VAFLLTLLEGVAALLLVRSAWRLVARLAGGRKAVGRPA